MQRRQNYREQQGWGTWSLSQQDVWKALCELEELCGENKMVDDGWRKRFTYLVRGTKIFVLVVERSYGEPLWRNLPCVSGMHTCKSIKVTVKFSVRVCLPSEGAVLTPSTD